MLLGHERHQARMKKRLRFISKHHSEPSLEAWSEEIFFIFLDNAIRNASAGCWVYENLGSSPFDRHVAMQWTDLKKYKRLLDEELKAFLKANKSFMKDPKIKAKANAIINEARQYQGEPIRYVDDPNARISRGDHTNYDPHY